MSAVISADENARQKLFDLAAPLLGVEATELESADGWIWSRDNTDNRIAWSQVMALRTVMGVGRFDADYSLSNCMMSFVEVAVDTRAGMVELLRVVNATDAGQLTCSRSRWPRCLA